MFIWVHYRYLPIWPWPTCETWMQFFMNMQPNWTIHSSQFSLVFFKFFIKVNDSLIKFRSFKYCDLEHLLFSNKTNIICCIRYIILFTIYFYDKILDWGPNFPILLNSGTHFQSFSIEGLDFYFLSN